MFSVGTILFSLLIAFVVCSVNADYCSGKNIPESDYSKYIERIENSVRSRCSRVIEAKKNGNQCCFFALFEKDGVQKNCCVTFADDVKSSAQSMAQSVSCSTVR